MLETGFAQIRFAASILFGTRFSLRSLDHLITSLQATQREFGFLRSEGRDLLVSPQLDFSVRHECGWTYPRQMAEALEALEEVPLPARYGYWAVPRGVAVEVVVRQATLPARHRVETSLQERGVPIRALHLLSDRSQLRHPMPLRGDLREHVFGTLTMDCPLTSERSVLPQAAEAMRIGEP